MLEHTAAGLMARIIVNTAIRTALADIPGAPEYVPYFIDHTTRLDVCESCETDTGTVWVHVDHDAAIVCPECAHRIIGHAANQADASVEFPVVVADVTAAVRARRGKVWTLHTTPAAREVMAA